MCICACIVPSHDDARTPPLVEPEGRAAELVGRLVIEQKDGVHAHSTVAAALAAVIVGFVYMWVDV